jgi:hypothetical protein
MKKAPKTRPQATLRLEEFEPRTVPTTVCGANPVYEAECKYLVDLIPHSAITLTAQQSGNWSDTATWGGKLPGNGDNVWIPNGITVTVDGQEPGALRSILDNGVLTFAPDRNTSLLVNTVVVGTDDNPTGLPQGELDIGTASAPILPQYTASLTFADLGPRSSVFPADWQQLSGGLISMSTCSIYGSQVTPYVAMQDAHAGDTTLTLSSPVTGWKAGDTLLLPGTSPTQNQDEQIQITSISGTTVTLASPLAYDHAAPQAGLQVYVANEARNVVLQSQNATDITRHGHVMFMHTDQEVVAYADFLNLGRTDKSQPLNNAKRDANGQLIPGTGTNQVGRYALHFHRDYWPTMSQNDPPVLVLGNFESGSPGWGYDNHSSNVDMEWNVGYNNVGASFASEAGNELGTYDHNLAVRETGSGAATEARIKVQDFGHGGDGFWLMSPLVHVTNNIATGSADAGFSFYNRQGLIQGALGTTMIPAADLSDPRVIQGRSAVPVIDVPFVEVSGNTTYGDGGKGAAIWWHEPVVSDSVGQFTVWGTGGAGVSFPFSDYTGLDHSWLLGSLSLPRNTGITSNAGYDHDLTFVGNRVEGWSTGIQLPSAGTNVVQDGYYNNVHDIAIMPQTQDFNTSQTVVRGNPQFGTLSAQALAGATQYHYFLLPVFPQVRFKLFSSLFTPQQILLQTQADGNKEVYFSEQAAGFVPFATAAAPDYLTGTVPAPLVGLTNQQMWGTYGLAMLGEPAPADAVADPSTNGLIGSVSAPPPYYILPPNFNTEVFTNQAQYYLRYRLYSAVPGTHVSGAHWVIEQQATPLQAGWNLLTRTINGQPHTFLVYLDQVKPTFAVDPTLPLVIKSSDLSNGFTVRGTVTDAIRGTNSYQTLVTGLTSLPVQTRPDGSRYIGISFTIRDPAGNATLVSLPLTLTA